ncbi:MAG: hypothetical protein ACTSRA_00085 [Promethearchaeota archaeon]
MPEKKCASCGKKLKAFDELLCPKCHSDVLAVMETMKKNLKDPLVLGCTSE